MTTPKDGPTAQPGVTEDRRTAQQRAADMAEANMDVFRAGLARRAAKRKALEERE